MPLLKVFRTEIIDHSKKTHHSLVLSKVEGSLTRPAKPWRSGITHHWRQRRQGLPSVALAKEGQILILALVMLAVFTILLLSMYSRLARFSLFSRNSYQKEVAVNLADGGIDYAVSQLNASPSEDYNGTLAFSGLGKVTVSVTTDGINKQITSIACIPDVAPNCKTQQKIVTQATTSGTAQTVSLQYAIEALGGGINLSSTYVKNSDVYSVGNITTSGNSQVCGHAFAQSVSASILFPNSAPSGCISPDTDGSAPYTTTFSCPSASCLTQLNPNIDYNLRKQSACDPTGAYTNLSSPSGCPQEKTSSATCPPPGTASPTSLGPGVYIGNLAINEGSGNTVLIKGDIWVTGNLTICGIGSLRPDGSLPPGGNYNKTSGRSPSIVVEGNIPSVAQIQTDTVDGTQYIWFLGCQSSAQTINISAANAQAVFYCPNSTVPVALGCISGTCSAYTRVGPILARGITFAACTGSYCSGPAGVYTTVYGGAGVNTPITFGSSSNSYWLIKRGTYLYKK